MAHIRAIKKRMVAVRNIQRITKTMQMIATAKFTNAMQRAQGTKPYTQKVRQLVAQVAAAAGDIDNPLLRAPEQPVNRELLLVISSDRGLCGAYNQNLLRLAIRHGRGLMSSGKSFSLEISGKKATGFFKFHGITIDERYTIGDKPRYEEVEKIAQHFMDDFTTGAYDAVRVIYTNFISATRQQAQVVQLLPLEPPSVEAMKAEASERRQEALYEFSPSSEELLAALLPMSVKTSLFQAFNDAVVSEQLMRMVAMKAATENAKELGRSLRRRFNRARQTQITTELMEIIAGAAALE